MYSRVLMLREFHEATVGLARTTRCRSRFESTPPANSLILCRDHPKVPKSREYTPAMVDALQEAGPGIGTDPR